MTHRKRRFLLASAFASAFAGMTMIVVATVFVGSSASAVEYTVVDLATLNQGSTVVFRGPNAWTKRSAAASSPVSTEDCT